MESWAPGVENFAWNVFSFGPGPCQKKPKMKCSGAQSLKVRNVCKPYYLLHLSHLGDLRGQSSEGRRGSFGGFFEKLRRSSVLNANVGAVSRFTWVAMGGPWAVLGSTWTPSWATAWPKCSFFGAFLVVSPSNCGILGPMYARFGPAASQRRPKMECSRVQS